MFGDDTYFETSIARAKYITSPEDIKNLQIGSILKSHGLYYHGLLAETKIVARRRHMVVTVLIGREELRICAACRDRHKKKLPNGVLLPSTVGQHGGTEQIIKELGESCSCLKPLLDQFKLPLP